MSQYSINNCFGNSEKVLVVGYMLPTFDTFPWQLVLVNICTTLHDAVKIFANHFRSTGITIQYKLLNIYVKFHVRIKNIK